ncbi:MAG: TetR/AcrR family transcriptional regulator [Robiginitomaculum sp.]|nr:TetR/AcrR family transcriptional regulator [Robiginitomaculum sp.]MDQ7078328.1 TetR/AcrR family transcriptional regulator [Robiginitomaculum sp.]
MARKVSIEETALLQRLSEVFRDHGYEGASLAKLSEAAGLKKASLYHRFPKGKEQMACEVLLAAQAWLSKNIVKPLKSKNNPRERIKAMAKTLDTFYSGGKQACLLNMLSSSRIQGGPFTGVIREAFDLWIDALTDVLIEAQMDRKEARTRAERAIALLQGNLVLARGMGTTRPFKAFLQTLPDELLG